MRTPFAATLLVFSLAAAAQGTKQIGPVDPWVPPAVRKEAAVQSPPSQGKALRAEVEQRLRAPFDAAARDGVLTRDQAVAAGLGFIAQNFEAIDRRGAGAIRFEDYKRFLKDRGAQLD